MPSKLLAALLLLIGLFAAIDITRAATATIFAMLDDATHAAVDTPSPFALATTAGTAATGPVPVHAAGNRQ